jgi:anti-sigma B factor antagonist
VLPVGIEFEACDGAVVVRVSGEIDMSSAAAFTKALVTAHEDGHLGNRVVIDLSDVTFFSSAGVAALVMFAEACAADRAVLRVVPTPMIQQVLTISGADQVVTVAKTLDEALRTFPDSVES